MRLRKHQSFSDTLTCIYLILLLANCTSNSKPQDQMGKSITKVLQAPSFPADQWDLTGYEAVKSLGQPIDHIPYNNLIGGAGITSLVIQDGALILFSAKAFPSLDTLNLHGNKLFVVTDLDKAPGLRSLNLSNNKLPYLYGSGIYTLENLTKLDLSTNFLKSIDEEAAQLIQLKDLNLSNNRLMEVPQVIGRMDNLEVLDLSYNNLAVLPGDAMYMKHTRHIDLSGNPLTPSQVDQLKRLLPGTEIVFK